MAALFVVLVLLAGCSVSGKGELAQPLEAASFVPLVGSEPRSFFGDAVAIDGDTLAVGAWGSDASAGSVRVYEWTDSGWAESELQRPSGVQEGDRFGHTVALAGDELVVGAPHSRATGSTAWTGAVYFYRRIEGVWQLEQKLMPQITTADAQFGGAVALADGVLAVVSAAAGQQALYLYEQDASGWTLQQSIELDPQGVGHRLAADEGFVAVGARVAADPAQTGDRGVLRLFERTDDTWANTAVPAVDEPGDCFGCSVAVSGDLLVVGSPSPSDGAAFVYRRSGDGWEQMGRFADASGSAHFGEAVAVSGDRLLVGAPGDDTAGENSGRLFVYTARNGEWLPTAELAPAELPEMSSFGGTISTDGHRLVAGASGIDGAAGAAFVANLPVVPSSSRSER